jgi:hypothetical protein
MEWDDFFAALDDDQVACVWARSMREMRDRKLIRSWNNPVADYAERLVAVRLDLELAPPVAQGYDAVDSSGRRYQIKSRRLTTQNKIRPLCGVPDTVGHNGPRRYTRYRPEPRMRVNRRPAWLSREQDGAFGAGSLAGERRTSLGGRQRVCLSKT